MIERSNKKAMRSKEVYAYWDSKEMNTHRALCMDITRLKVRDNNKNVCKNE